MKQVKLVSLIVVVSLVVVASCKPVRQQPFNVLFIAIDDLNDWTGFAGGHPQAITPNMDRLAAQGLVFERAYCAASLCNPSRAALMTGYRPSTTGVYENGNYMRDSEVLKDAQTIPQYFSAHGYHSMARGKIFHRPNGKWADTISWDQFAGTQGSYGEHRRREGYLASGIPRGEADDNFDWGPTNALFEATPDYLNVKWAAEQLDREHEKPFFLACGIFRPHLKWHVPQEFFDKFPEKDMILPDINENDHDDIPDAALKPSKNYYAAKKYRKQQSAIQAYLACINYADSCVGVILEALASSKYAENTIVVLWGDHGWHLGEKLRYKKFTLWEEACRMPLIIMAPGITRPGTRCAAPVSLLDLYPTLTELCGLPPNTENEGRSIVPLLREVDADWNTPVLTTMGYKKHSLRDRRWRYIVYSDGSEELYDHDADPLEWTNLAEDPSYETIKNSMRNYLPLINEPEIVDHRDIH